MNTEILHQSEAITIWQHHLHEDRVVLTFNEDDSFERLEMDKREAIKWAALDSLPRLSEYSKEFRIYYLKDTMRPEPACAVAAVLEERQTEVHLPDFMRSHELSEQQRIARAVLPMPALKPRRNIVRRLIEAALEKLGV